MKKQQSPFKEILEHQEVAKRKKPSEEIQVHVPWEQEEPEMATAIRELDDLKGKRLRREELDKRPLDFRSTIIAVDRRFAAAAGNGR